MFSSAATFIKLFFGGALKRLLAIWEWLLDHPAVLSAIVCLIGGLLLGYGYRDRSADKEIKTLQQAVIDAQTNAKTEADKIRLASETKVKELEALNAGLRTDLSQLLTNYQTDLQAAIKKQKIVLVKAVTATGKPVDISFEGEKNVCSAYPSTYAETVNRMVERSKEALK